MLDVILGAVLVAFCWCAVTAVTLISIRMKD